MMDYAETSQARHWSFTPAHIAKARENNRKRVVGKLGRAGPSDDRSDVPAMLEVDDEVLLQRCWHYKLQDMCREESSRTPDRFTHRVMTTAHAYMRRFFLRRSIVEDDPRELLLAAVYLAAKVEEERIELADLTRFSRLSSDREAAERLILSNEESILATLGYELVVRAPHRALSGILVSLRARRRAGDDTTGAGGGAVAGLSPSEEPILGAEAMATIESKARDFIGHALCADAPLLFSPQQLAMAGVMRGAAAAGIDLRPWLNRWLRRSGDAGTADGDQALRFEQLLVQVGASVDAEGGALDAAAMARCKEIEARRAALSRVVAHVDAVSARARADADAQQAAARKQARAADYESVAGKLVGADAMGEEGEGGDFAIRKRARPREECPPTARVKAEAS